MLHCDYAAVSVIGARAVDTFVHFMYKISILFFLTDIVYI